MLIGCAAYQDGKKIGDLDIDQIPDYLQRPKCFVWVALHDPLASELKDMQQLFGLHPLAVEDAQRASAAQSRGIRRFLVRCSAYGRAERRGIPGRRTGGIRRA
jgi:hypothetical protein